MRDRANDSGRAHDDALLDGLLAAAASDEPTEMDVARLRRRVREGLREEAPSTSTRTSVLRGLALASALALAVAALHVMSTAEFHLGAPVSGTEPVEMALSVAPDGSVRVEVQGDQARIRSLTKSDSPVPGSGAVVTPLDDGTFVDPGSENEPGTLVFYRVD
jgi:hypothetical protein